MRKSGTALLVLLFAATIATGPSRAVDTSTQATDDVAQARALIDAEDFEAALAILEAAIAQNPKDANALNLAGFAARQSGNLGDAATYYANALDINPNHKGALEYQGELYLSLKRPLKAKANLERLRDICGETCEEYLDLAEEIAAFEVDN